MLRILAVLVIGLAGCASQPVVPPPAPAAPLYTAGSIYQAGGAHDWFGDRRARRVGDVLTIILVEQTQAQSSSATSTGKTSDLSLPGPTLFGGPVTANGIPFLNNSFSGDRSFEGGGDSSQSNQLSGSISVRVVEVDAQGLMYVEGRKHLQLNRGDETLEIRGWVRPEDVAADNTLLSNRVADAQVRYAGRGALGDANAQGWLARFFNHPLWPF
jgi:flagellar L-ring protein FlgH